MIALPKVSIIVPIYNTEKYIKECLLSLLNQTYKNIEIICIDDGSTDDSLSIVEKYAKLDKRIVILTQKHKGVSAARNMGLKAMTGNYVMSCDSDDFFRLDAVALCIKMLLTHDECEAVFFNARNFYDNGVEFLAFPDEPYGRIPTVIECAESGFLAGFGNVCFGMFSASLIQTNNLLFREGYIYEDWDFVAHFTALARKVCWLNVNLYNYRRKLSGTITGVATAECLDIFITLELVEQYYKATGRWENNEYIFYLKAVSHIIYFDRDRLRNAQNQVKEAFNKKGQEFIQTIPYSMLCSLARFFPLADRVSILEIHADHDIEVQFCLDNLKRQKRAERKARIKSFFKKILMMIFPAYRVAVNTRFEMEQMHGELMSKLNEITWLQYENRKDINLILRKLGVDKEARLTEEILVARENENYIK